MKTSLVAILLAVFWSLPTSAEAEDAFPDTQAGVAHVVLVWLKEPGNAEHRQRLIGATQKLREIPQVLDLRVGEVIPSEREVVTDDYDVGIYVRFASRGDLKTYLEHPIHTGKLAEVFVPISERFQVFDFAISEPTSTGKPASQ